MKYLGQGIATAAIWFGLVYLIKLLMFSNYLNGWGIAGMVVAALLSTAFVWSEPEEKPAPKVKPEKAPVS